MPSYDNDAMAVIKGTGNDGVVVARADADAASVQCAVVRTSILNTKRRFNSRYKLALQFSALMVVESASVRVPVPVESNCRKWR
jgi:hypothetical protein